jgi:hypothetical protein
MRCLLLLSAPPSIAVTDEPLAGGGTSGPVAFGSTDGFELVAAWQARPPRRVRRLSAAVPLLAVAATAALWVGRGDDVRALPERPADAVAPERSPGRALVVSAGPARRADLRRPAR